MPVASMSIRFLIGSIQTLVTPGTCTGIVERGPDRVHRHPRPPLVAGFELDGGLDHRQRRRVGGGVGTAELAEDGRDLGHGGDEPVGLLQDLARLADGDAGVERGHVEEVALVQLRHELRADALAAATQSETTSATAISTVAQGQATAASRNGR